MAAGSAFQCYHGDRVHLHTILEWRPIERVLTQDRLDFPVRSPMVLSEYRLETVEMGTRLPQSLAGATGPLLGRTLVNAMMKLSRKDFQEDIEQFKEHIEADHAAQSGIEPAQVETRLAEVG